MNLRIGSIISAGVLLAFSSLAFGQRNSGAETGLLGIKLYSTGITVISHYGTPDSIEAVNIGGAGGAPGAGPGSGIPGVPGGPGGPGGPAGRGGGSGPNRSGGAPTAGYTGFDFGDSLLQSSAPMPGRGKKGGQGGGGFNGAPGVPSGAGAPGVPGAAGAPGGGASGSSTGEVIFTRWIYNRNGCQYGFVFDKYNRVVQIEAVGLSNPKVSTMRGIHFGASIAQVVARYERNPGGSIDYPEYEINGDVIVLKFLIKNHVAFRFTRLVNHKPQVVTGIAVAAGKY